nr:CFF_HP1_G0031340.mRNA.1.CDS.1 [Saccharomyces cerevisiae]
MHVSLFLKLHGGEPRPISLKTDTIKSRNQEKLNNNNVNTNANTHSNDPNKIFKRKGETADNWWWFITYK